jgi:hypothetical protein
VSSDSFRLRWRRHVAQSTTRARTNPDAHSHADANANPDAYADTDAHTDSERRDHDHDYPDWRVTEVADGSGRNARHLYKQRHPRA